MGYKYYKKIGDEVGFCMRDLTSRILAGSGKKSRFISMLAFTTLNSPIPILRKRNFPDSQMLNIS